MDETIEILMSAIDENKLLGAPLSVQQVLNCSLQLLETSALPLIVLVNNMQPAFDDGEDQCALSCM